MNRCFVPLISLKKSVKKFLLKNSENGFFSLESATPGGLKFFALYFDEKFFF
nr:MAG TPA: hypothetical protein [Bacteriophage sp.]